MNNIYAINWSAALVRWTGRMCWLSSLYCLPDQWSSVYLHLLGVNDLCLDHFGHDDCSTIDMTYDRQHLADWSAALTVYKFTGRISYLSTSQYTESGMQTRLCDLNCVVICMACGHCHTIFPASIIITSGHCDGGWEPFEWMNLGRKFSRLTTRSFHIF